MLLYILVCESPKKTIFRLHKIFCTAFKKTLCGRIMTFLAANRRFYAAKKKPQQRLTLN